MSTTNKKVFFFLIVTVVVLGLTLQPKKAEEDIIPLPVIKPVSEVPIVLQKIAWCESENRQFNKDGSVYRGEINPKDIGTYQISETYWLDISNQLGYNIYTEEGNKQMALYIYEKYGTQPWSASKHCWKVSTMQ
jgi:hypothetical protein